MMRGKQGPVLVYSIPQIPTLMHTEKRKICVNLVLDYVYCIWGVLSGNAKTFAQIERALYLPQWEMAVCLKQTCTYICHPATSTAKSVSTCSEKLGSLQIVIASSWLHPIASWISFQELRVFVVSTK